MFDWRKLIAAYLPSIVRHGLTTLSGVLVGIGVSEADANSFLLSSNPVIVGLLLYVLGQGMSFVDKKGR